MSLPAPHAPEASTQSAPTFSHSAGKHSAPAAVQPPRVDESKLAATYANFCRVTGTPEELLVDFGLNAQPIGVQDEPIAVTQRIVLNYFTAKRLLQALGMSVARHEQVFGELETNVLKRAEKK